MIHQAQGQSPLMVSLLSYLQVHYIWSKWPPVLIYYHKSQKNPVGMFCTVLCFDKAHHITDEEQDSSQLTSTVPGERCSDGFYSFSTPPL